MSKKLTYAAVIGDVLEGKELTPERIERLEALKAQYEKRTASKRVGPTKAQLANAEIVRKVLEAMEAGESYDTSAICALVDELAGATPQKVSPIMKKLVESGAVASSKVKGRLVYTLADEAEG